MNMNIGFPELLFVLIVIVLPLWAIRRFPLPRNRAPRYALLFAVALLVAVFVWNYTSTFRAVE
jgi:multisubunit Na+/H+ antiporter MnhB subunit